MFGWFGGPDREARQLNRDAPRIIETAHHSYRAEILRDIALLTRRELKDSIERLEQFPEQRTEAIRRYQSQHREARRRNDQMSLTAYTLVIIYLRAGGLGAAAAPAQQSIESFLDQWEHAAD